MKKFILLVILMMSFLGCKKDPKKIQKSKFLFGTYIDITVYEIDENKANRAIEAAFNEIERIDKKLNSQVEGSFIDILNKSVDKSIEIDEESIEVFEKVTEIYNLSNGKFDITMTPLRSVWGFDKEKVEKIPTLEELELAISKVDYSKVLLKGNQLSYEEPVEKIDTGSFLKGYAIKEAKKVMIKNGIESAFISAVSSIETIGTKPNEELWRIGLQNPENTSEMLEIVNLNDKAMGVSGDYQTYIEVDGKKYHHILDVITGYPIKDKRMVAVICENSFLGDLYSTAFFTMEVDEVLKIVEETENLEVLIVTGNNEVVTSSKFNVK